jgi:antitoxin PrlF
MQKIVKITRKGQTTIPSEIRAKLGLKVGDVLAVDTVNNEIVFRPIPKIEDCGGIFAGHANVAELKKEIDNLREEY